MNITEKDYRIWENDKFTVESSIDLSLWDRNIIDNFQENLTQVLEEVYNKSDVNLSKSMKSISLSFSGDKKIIELNYYYRKLKLPTNVLSFPSSYSSNNTLFLGDIIFSNETICKEAKRDSKSINNHLTHLFIHGVLHLIGYDHETEEQAKKMEDLEIKILSNLQIDNPYD